VGYNSYKNVQLPKIFKTKQYISKASSYETAHLRKVQMENISANVACKSDTNSR